MSSSREREKNARRRKQMIKRRRQIAIIAVELVLLVILGGCCYVISALNKMQENELDKDQIYRPSFTQKEEQTKDDDSQGNVDSTVSDKGESQDKNDNPIFNYNSVIDQYWNILLVGLDYRPTNDDPPRSDVMIVCSINKANNEIKLTSVYRDTYMKTGTGYTKVNESYFHGGIYDTINTLNRNLDIYITDYVIVDWEVVAKCVNLLGGIEAEITEEFIDEGFYNSLVTEIVEETGIASNQIWKPGKYTLDGVQTVAYCRLRYSDSDYKRTERQRQVIEQLLQKAQNEVKSGNVGLLISIMNELTESVRFSISEGDLLNMIIHANSFNITGQCGYPFDKVTDHYVGKINVTYPVVPVTVESNVRKLHEFLYGEGGYEPSSVLKDISKYVEKISGES